MPTPPSRPFGPFYPATLQSSVNHAERLAAVLENAQEHARTLLSSTATRDLGTVEVWLTGRISELEAFVADVIDDWRRGIVSAGEASAAMDRYLSSVHRGVRTYLTDGDAPTCCKADENATVEPGPSSYANVYSEELLVTPTPAAR